MEISIHRDHLGDRFQASTSFLGGVEGLRELVHRLTCPQSKTSRSDLVGTIDMVFLAEAVYVHFIKCLQGSKIIALCSDTDHRQPHPLVTSADMLRFRGMCSPGDEAASFPDISSGKR